MGRGKIEIKKIENVNSRQVTFSKRRSGLLKKAKELSVLCDADIAVIIYSSTGKLYDFSSRSMDQILSRYTKAPNNVELPTIENAISETPHSEIYALKDEIARLRAQNMRMQGKCLEGLSLKDLQQLEHQLNEGMLSVKAKKDAERNLLMEQLEKSRKQAVMEKETLRKEVEELREALRSSCEESPTLKRKHSAITSAQDEVCNGVGVENNEHSFDVSLRLGMLPTVEGCNGEKTLKLESNSDESTSHMAST